MSLTRHFALVASLVASAPATANEIAVFNELSSEYADCFAYYTIAKRCAPREVTEGQLSQMQSQIEKTGDMAIAAGRLAGISDEAVGTRYLGAMTTLSTLMENTCDNFPLLIQKHNDACRLLLENPKQREQELREQLKP